MPATATSKLTRRPDGGEGGPRFRPECDRVPSSTSKATTCPSPPFPIDGTFPTGTTQWEKRNLALEIPVWEPDLCIQCGKCMFVCPHAVIRHKVYDKAAWQNAPQLSNTWHSSSRNSPGMAYTVQVAPEDCTGCTLCVEACPVKDKTQVGRKAINMAPQPALREQEAVNWDFFMSLPDVDRTLINPGTIKNSQLLRPLFEFSGACAGCGETPTSSWSRSSLATAPSSQMPPAVPPFMAATCPPRRGRSTRRAAALPGPTRCSRTMRSSVWGCA